MDSDSKPRPEHDQAKAATHVAGAHEILKTLQEKMGAHPEIGAAITQLETALNLLAVKTGGVL